MFNWRRRFDWQLMSRAGRRVALTSETTQSAVPLPSGSSGSQCAFVPLFVHASLPNSLHTTLRTNLSPARIPTLPAKSSSRPPPTPHPPRQRNPNSQDSRIHNPVQHKPRPHRTQPEYVQSVRALPRQLPSSDDFAARLRKSLRNDLAAPSHRTEGPPLDTLLSGKQIITDVARETEIIEIVLPHPNRRVPILHPHLAAASRLRWTLRHPPRPSRRIDANIGQLRLNPPPQKEQTPRHRIIQQQTHDQQNHYPNQRMSNPVAWHALDCCNSRAIR